MELEETAGNNNEGVNKNWENIVTAPYNDSSKACLGYMQRRPKEWILIPGKQLKVDES